MYTWLSCISYLYFFENNFAIDILIAKETIAIPIESPINFFNILNDGISGFGNLLFIIKELIFKYIFKIIIFIIIKIKLLTLEAINLLLLLYILYRV